MHDFTTLMRRLSRAGFKNDFVRQAILPDWWDVAHSQDSSLLPDIEIRVARFLGLPLSTIKDSKAPLTPSSYAGALLRRVRDIDHDRLAPAIHAAIRVAMATVRNLRNPSLSPDVPPSDGRVWRNQLVQPQPSSVVTLDAILGNLWSRGIPVVPVEILPSPSFQAMAWMADDRPVIMIGHQYDEPGHVAFIVSHETGHLVAGDCTPTEPMVDEDDEVKDETDIERRADGYATDVVVGSNPVLDEDGDAKQVARRAAQLERETGTDAGFIIYSWASRTGDYGRASMAVRALYRDSGARRLLRRHFAEHVDVTGASESDFLLFRCVLSEQALHAATAGH